MLLLCLFSHFVAHISSSPINNNNTGSLVKGQIMNPGKWMMIMLTCELNDNNDNDDIQCDRFTCKRSDNEPVYWMMMMMIFNQNPVHCRIIMLNLVNWMIYHNADIQCDSSDGGRPLSFTGTASMSKSFKRNRLAASLTCFDQTDFQVTTVNTFHVNWTIIINMALPPMGVIYMMIICDDMMMALSPYEIIYMMITCDDVISFIGWPTSCWWIPLKSWTNGQSDWVNYLLVLGKTSHKKNRFLSGIAQITSLPSPQFGQVVQLFLDVKNNV